MKKPIVGKYYVRDPNKRYMAKHLDPFKVTEVAKGDKGRTFVKFTFFSREQHCWGVFSLKEFRKRFRPVPGILEPLLEIGEVNNSKTNLPLQILTIDLRKYLRS